MSPPSELLPAGAVAQECFDRYSAKVSPDLPFAIRDDLEAVAEAIKVRSDFRSVFIHTIVPWERFTAPRWNAGHEAIADFILCSATSACLSANYDVLIERAGWELGGNIQVALSGTEATEAAAFESPLLKFHGCMVKDKDRTVWTSSQFDTDGVLRERRQSNVDWMRANLQEKDLLVVGFWSDWSYLNSAFDAALQGAHPRSITLVDPTPTERLKDKAPALWSLAHQENVAFRHVQQSGHNFLDELRVEMTKSFLRQLSQRGTAAYERLRPGAAIAAQAQHLSDVDTACHYEWRRDAEGRNSREPCKLTAPSEIHEAVALAHVLLRNAGGTPEASWYDHNQAKVRVVNWAGRNLEEARVHFVDGAALAEPDYVVCAGAMDLIVPANIVRDAEPPSVVRPGSKARWLTLEQAILELSL